MTKSLKTTKTPRTTQTKTRRPTGQPAKKPRRSAPSKKTGHRASPVKRVAAVRGNTKQAVLIKMLKRSEGATIADLAKATGWQTHSVRGAISGSLKKKLGLEVVSEKVEDRPRRYRIVEDRADSRS
jgi:hypothetical protein